MPTDVRASRSLRLAVLRQSPGDEGCWLAADPGVPSGRSHRLAGEDATRRRALPRGFSGQEYALAPAAEMARPDLCHCHRPDRSSAHQSSWVWHRLCRLAQALSVFYGRYGGMAQGEHVRQDLRAVLFERIAQLPVPADTGDAERGERKEAAEAQIQSRPATGAADARRPNQCRAL